MRLCSEKYLVAKLLRIVELVRIFSRSECPESRVQQSLAHLAAFGKKRAPSCHAAMQQHELEARTGSSHSQSADAWRLPAEQLEQLIADLIRTHLHRPDGVTRLIRDLSASETEDKTARLQAIQQAKPCLALVERADVSPGTLTVRLARDELARDLRCETDRIDAEDLTLTSPFRMRRRGVELKLHLGEAPPEIDRTLIQNVVRAQKWMAMILGGKTFTEIAESEGTSKRRVQDVIDLAMLAPDILDAIANGEQPDGLTSDALIKSGVPATWSEQRAQFAKL